MEYTGERMVPEAASAETFWEHVYRYAFACKYVRRLNVLDIASGEGYGTDALSKVAKRVVGVDINAEAVEYSRGRYSLDFRVGGAERIPVDANSMDAVISFETIEHLQEPKVFVDEVFRVLKPNGLFIASTPNKGIYRNGKEPNPFHFSELTQCELEALLRPRFAVKTILGQVFQSDPLDEFQATIGRVSCRMAYYLRRRIEVGLRRRYLPDITCDIQRRLRIIESIPFLSPPLSRIWNPFGIRALTTSGDDQPEYFVAVATRRVF